MPWENGKGKIKEETCRIGSAVGNGQLFCLHSYFQTDYILKTNDEQSMNDALHTRKQTLSQSNCSLHYPNYHILKYKHQNRLLQDDICCSR